MVMEKFRLDNKVALITGGSRGIGKAIAAGFLQAGANVVIASRKQAELDQTSQEIAIPGRRCFPVAAHAAKNDELEKLVNKTMEEFGRIDILVCNAATNPQSCDVIDTEEWAWDVVMNVNLKGYFLLCKKVVPFMIKQRGGSIIFTGSTNGFKPNRGVGVYAVSKAGVHLLAQVLAYELGKYGIRVNTLAPGATRTAMVRTALERDDAKMEKVIAGRTALCRIAETEDMIGAAIFLGSDASKFVTGQTLVVDGGAVTYIY